MAYNQTDVASVRSRPMTSEEKKVILASSAGTIFEWYDFYLYGSLAAIIGAQFFTAFPEATRNVFALLAFAAGAIAGRKIEVKRLDLRPQAIEITAQEMLTKDRIALRVTLTAFRRIVDPERVVATVPDVDAWLYRLVQFAIREAVAGRTLDEVLSAKTALDEELRDYVRGRVAGSGVEVTELGVKDVILPGEIRELVNKVVEAERVAKANLIRRQEETAATRSLLNTAKLMEENPLLLRLKELESLERLVEKVGRIDLHAGDGQGLDALLTKLVRLKAPESA